MKEHEMINTSALAKIYRTTTSDVEKKLTREGVKPIRTVTMETGRRFMTWEKSRALEVLDQCRERRLAQARAREAAASGETSNVGGLKRPRNSQSFMTPVETAGHTPEVAAEPYILGAPPELSLLTYQVLMEIKGLRNDIVRLFAHKK